MTRIREAGGFVSFDPNIRHDLWADPQQLHDALSQAFTLADVVKLSEEELAFLVARRISTPACSNWPNASPSRCCW